MDDQRDRYRGPTNAQVVGLLAVTLVLTSGVAAAVMTWLERSA